MDYRTVLVVCRENVYSSVAASACLNQSLMDHGFFGQIVAISRGIQGCRRTAWPRPDILMDYEPAWWLAEAAAKSVGIELPRHRSFPLTAEDVEHASLILGMDRAALYDLALSVNMQYPGQLAKLRLYAELADRECDIVDCLASGDLDEHYQFFEFIHRLAERYIDRLVDWARHPRILHPPRIPRLVLA